MAFSWRAMLSYPFRRMQATARTVSSYDDHRRFIGHIQGVWRGLGAKKSPSNRQESFQNAYVRLGLDEVRLAATHKHFMFRFWISSGATALGIGMLLYTLMSKPLDSADALGSIGAILGFVAISLSLAFNASFRLYQIERRELTDGAAWWQARESWIPAPFQAQTPAQAPGRTALRSVR